MKRTLLKKATLGLLLLLPMAMHGLNSTNSIFNFDDNSEINIYRDTGFEVSSSNPAENASNVVANTTIGVTFSDNIDASTVNSTNIVVWGQLSGTISGSWGVSGAVATFTPSSTLLDGEVIHVEISTSVTSTGATALGSKKSFSFSVRAKTPPLGEFWAKGSTSVVQPWTSVAFGTPRGEKRYVAVSSTGSNRVMWSNNGVSWAAGSGGANTLGEWSSVTYGVPVNIGGTTGTTGRFVAVASKKDGGISDFRAMWSGDGKTWAVSDVTPANVIWSSVTFGNGRYVAVGADANMGNGRVMVSSNAIDWAAATPAGDYAWSAITYGNGKFIAVAGSDASDRPVMWSEDGITWTLATTTQNNNWRSVTYGNGRYVAVAENGTNDRVMWSEDGDTWNSVSGFSNNEWSSVSFGNGRFMAVAKTGTNRVMYSSDGQSWTSAQATEENDWSSITYGGDKFVAVSNNGDNRVMYSDTRFFVDATIPAKNATNIQPNSTIKLTFNVHVDPTTVTTDNIIVRGQQSGKISGTWNVNVNEITFTPSSNLLEGEVIHVEPSPSVTSTVGVALGFSDSFSFTVAPKQPFMGESWTSTSATLEAFWTALAYGRPQGTGRFVALNAVGFPGPNNAMWSDDGVSWTESTSGATGGLSWRTITYGTPAGTSGRYLAMAASLSDNNGGVMYTDDGKNWSQINTGLIDVSWHSVTYGNGRYVGVGVDINTLNGAVGWSLDGVTWTKGSPAANQQWHAVTYGNGRFVALTGDYNKNRPVMWSTDGATWTLASTTQNNNWTSVAYGNGRFVAVAQDGINEFAMWSTDGHSWTSVQGIPKNKWKSVSFGNGRFVAVAETGTNRVMYSEDGQIWSFVDAAENNAWQSITYGGDKFVATSTSGTNRVMYSTIPFVVMSNTPSSNATEIETNATISLTFNETVDATTVTSSNILVRGQLSGTISGSWNVIDAVATFTPNTALPNGEVIHVEPSNLVQSSSGKPLGTTFSYSFTTKPAEPIFLGYGMTSSTVLTNDWRAISFGNDRFVAVSASGTNRMMYSDDGQSWTSSNVTEPNIWESVTYGINQYVAVSSEGNNRVAISNDGITWSPAIPAEANAWRSVTYGNKRYVAVSSDGTNRVMWSDDGSTWTSGNGAETNEWRSVAYGNGRFVAIASSGSRRVMWSPDGKNWAGLSATEANSWRSITYANGRFVAVSSDGTNRVMWSTDGRQWTSASASEANFWSSVTYGNGRFIALSKDGSNRLMFSANGENWTSAVTPENNAWSSVTFGKGMYVAVSSDGTNRGMFIKTPSFDIVEFSPSRNSANNAIDSQILLTFNGLIDASTLNSSNIIVYGRQSGAIAGNWNVSANKATFTPTNSYTNGEVVHVSISSDLATIDGRSLSESIDYSFTAAPTQPEVIKKWYKSTNVTSSDWNSVAFGNGRFVAVGRDGNDRIMYSDDGRTWTRVTAPQNNNLRSVTFGIPNGTNGRFVAVSSDGTNRVIYSDDGISWTVANAAAANQWFSVTFGQGRYVAVSFDGTNKMMYSDDGITWQSAANSIDKLYNSVTYGNGRFVAISQFGGVSRAVYSDDGITWSESEATPNGFFSSVVYGNGKFVAVGFNGTARAIYSTDGVSWSAGNLSTSNQWWAVTYGDGQFVAVARSGSNRLGISKDGQTWTTAQAKADDNFWQSITYGNGKFAAVASYSSTSNYAMYGQKAHLEISSTNPVNNATDIDVSSKISIMFSENVDAATVNSTNITVSGQTAGTINGTWAVNEAIATFTPDADLTNADVITVQLSSSILSLTGSDIEPNKSFVFTVIPAITSVDPTSLFTSIIPAINATKVALNSSIDITLKAELDANSINENSIIVRGEQSGVIPGSWAVDGATATFSTQSLFPAGEVIHVELIIQVPKDGGGTSTVTSGYAFTTIPIPPYSGENWVMSTGAIAGVWKSITYGVTFGTDNPEGQFVAVGTGGPFRTIYSKDGINWSRGSVPEGGSWTSVTHGYPKGTNGRYVAVADAGTNRVMYSDDGQTWSMASAAAANSWTSITFGKGLYVAVSTDGTNRTMWSEDGVTWNAGATPVNNDRWNSVTYGNGRFVAVSLDRSNRVMWSEDGKNWTTSPAAAANPWSTITFGNGRFVAISLFGPNHVMWSENGESWTSSSEVENNIWRSVTYGNGRFVAIASSGTNRVMWSEDGVSWTASTSPVNNVWQEVAFGGDRFVAVSDEGSGGSLIMNSVSTLNPVEITGTEGWRMLANPMVDSTYAGFLKPLWTQGAPGADFVGGGANVLTWQSDAGNGDLSNWAPISDFNTSFTPGQGALVWVFSDDNGPGEEGDAGFPKTLTVKGPSASTDIVLDANLNQNMGGFTLLGNPYPFNIDWDNIQRTGLTDAVYVWDHNGSAWKTWNGSVGSLTDGIIGNMNGFFVETSGANPTLTVPISAHNDDESAFVGKAIGESEPSFFSLDLKSGQESSSIIVHLSEAAQLLRDNLDALWLQPLNPTNIEFAALTEAGEQLSIFSAPNSAQIIEIPLMVNVKGSGKALLSMDSLASQTDYNVRIWDSKTEEFYVPGETIRIYPELPVSKTVETEAASSNEEKSGKFELADRLPRLQRQENIAQRYILQMSKDPFKSAFAELPEEITLEQNFPNPFNPSTTFRFGLTQKANVSITIMDVLGRVVAQPVQGVKSAGWHSYSWGASSLTSGVYFYHLMVEGRISQTMKMTLIK